MKYSTRPNNSKDRSQQVNRSPHFNFQKQHRPQQDVNTRTILDTQPVSVPVVQPTQIATTQPHTVIAKVQQPQRPASVSAQPASFLVVDDQQPGNSRQLMFTFSPAKTVETFHYSTSRWTHHNHFHPLNFNQHHRQCHLLLIKNSPDLPASPASRVSPNKQISLH